VPLLFLVPGTFLAPVFPLDLMPLMVRTEMTAAVMVTVVAEMTVLIVAVLANPVDTVSSQPRRQMTMLDIPPRTIVIPALIPAIVPIEIVNIIDEDYVVGDADSDMKSESWRNDEIRRRRQVQKRWNRQWRKRWQRRERLRRGGNNSDIKSADLQHWPPRQGKNGNNYSKTLHDCLLFGYNSQTIPLFGYRCNSEPGFHGQGCRQIP
jgi:hypothetical protein